MLMKSERNKTEGLVYPSIFYKKEWIIMLELEENTRLLTALKEKLQDLGDSL